MRHKGKKKPIFLENILITEAAAEGKALAKIEKKGALEESQLKVVFITGGIPGDLVNVEVTKQKSSFWEAKVTKLLSPSPDRVEAFCEHFGLCGGCKWQMMSYEKQLFYKQKQIKDHFQRIGKLTFSTILPILPAEKTQYYRNKLDYTFSNQRWLTEDQIQSAEKFDRRALGFHVSGQFDKIVDVNTCYLQNDDSNKIRNTLRTFVLEQDLSFHDIKKHEGLLRNLIIRTASAQLMVIVVFYAKTDIELQQRKAVLDFLAHTFPQITSLMYVNNLKMNDDIADQEVILWKGKDHIIEEMPISGDKKLQFKISPKSFYQTNSQQAYELYKVVRDFADLQKGDIVYDLYTGTGTIAQFIAAESGIKKMIGIEYVESAIENAKENAKENGLQSITQFFAGDMKKILTTEFVAEHGAPNVLITDPPRAGMDLPVVEQILKIKPKKIVYVSCNSATQARDLAILEENYRITHIQAVDMFPHTHHVENVVALVLK